jgi:hypothetical protein
MSSDRKDLRVDYFPHRVRSAGKASPKDASVAPYDVSVVQEVSQVEVVEAEVVSEETAAT